MLELDLLASVETDLQEIVDLVDRVELLDFFGIHLAESQGVEPFAGEICVVARVEKGTAEVTIERGVFGFLPLFDGTVVVNVATGEIAKFAVYKVTVSAAASDAAVDVLIDLNAVHEGAGNTGKVRYGIDLAFEAGVMGDSRAD